MPQPVEFDPCPRRTDRPTTPPATAKRPATRMLGALTVSLLLVLSVGCASTTKPRKSCVVFHASPNLNLYQGEPHPITVYVYPLSSAAGFQQMTADRLRDGDQPDGSLGAAVPVTVSPSEKQTFREVFPARTRHLGLLADFYRAPGDPQGSLTHVVPARCGWLRKPRVILSPRDIYGK